MAGPQQGAAALRNADAAGRCTRGGMTRDVQRLFEGAHAPRLHRAPAPDLPRHV